MLINPDGHYEVMFALILIPILIALVAVMVYTLGVDSRIDEVARRRGFDD